MRDNTWERTRSGPPLEYPTGRGCVGETELGVRAFIASDDRATIDQRLFDAGQRNGC